MNERAHLRAVPPRYFAHPLTMLEKQILSRAVKIQTEKLG